MLADGVRLQGGMLGRSERGLLRQQRGVATYLRLRCAMRRRRVVIANIAFEESDVPEVHVIGVPAGYQVQQQGRNEEEDTWDVVALWQAHRPNAYAVSVGGEVVATTESGREVAIAIAGQAAALRYMKGR
jgi:hypothetical protein